MSGVRESAADSYRLRDWGTGTHKRVHIHTVRTPRPTGREGGEGCKGVRVEGRERERGDGALSGMEMASG